MRNFKTWLCASSILAMTACAPTDRAIDEAIDIGNYAPATPVEAIIESSEEIANDQGQYLSGRLLSLAVRMLTRMKKYESLDEDPNATLDPMPDKMLRFSGGAMMGTFNDVFGEYPLVGEYVGRINGKTGQVEGVIKNVNFANVNEAAFEEGKLREVLKTMGALSGSLKISGQMSPDTLTFYKTGFSNEEELEDLMEGVSIIDIQITGNLGFTPPSWNTEIDKMLIQVDAKSEMFMTGIEGDKDTYVVSTNTDTLNENTIIGSEAHELEIYIVGF